MSDSPEQMSFCLYACFPQVPSVAAVRIAFTERDGVYHDIGRISEEDDRAFWFCEANQMFFSSNARLCVTRISNSLDHDSLVALMFDSRRADELDGIIVATLIAMSLERAAPGKCGELEQKLRAMGDWDRHKVASFLADAVR